MIYRFRCPEHGEFEVDQSIETTTPSHPCPYHYGDDSPELYSGAFCRAECPKVLGSNIIYSEGREKFHGDVPNRS